MTTQPTPAAPTPEGLSPEDLKQIETYLKEEGVSEDDARLQSEESLQAWILTHPALRQAVFIENLAQLAPALLQALRTLLQIG